MPSNSSLFTSFKLTEKTQRMSRENTYVFVVRRSATKSEIAKAVKAEFKVTPKSVRTTRGGGVKKAMVTLKPGDTIIETAKKPEEEAKGHAPSHEHVAGHEHAHAAQA